MLDSQVLDRFNAIEAFRTQGPIRSYRGVTDDGFSVCIKVVDIEPEFAEETLRALAAVQAIGSPHIATILETGTTPSGYYYAREWVEGTHLGTRPLPATLSPAKAAAAVAQGLEGLSAIHRAGLVCGDVRPENFVMGIDGHVKLVDVVTPPGHVGEEGDPASSAYYTSPEELAGVHPSVATDIYRAGLVLYTVLAARPPYDGLDAAAVIAGHESASAAPLASGPGVSKALAAIAAKAIAKDPVARYHSAEEMEAALVRALRPSAWKWVAIVAAVIVVAGLIAGGVMLATRGPSAVAVPALAGQSRVAAQKKLADAGLSLGKVSQVETLGVEPGTVTTQSPSPGASVDASTAVNITVAVMPVATVPGLTGAPLSSASQRLAQAGLQVGMVGFIFDADTAAGLVMSQVPSASAEASPGTYVSLTVSKGPKGNTVPAVVGLAEQDASAVLVARGFKVKITRAEDPEIVPGNVVAQVPADGDSAVKGATVTVTVSKGPKGASSAAVPDVAGQSVAEALRALGDAGFAVKVAFAASDPASVLKVASQQPAAAAKADAGSPVTITIGLPAFLFELLPKPLPAPPVSAIPATASVGPTDTGGGQ
jgi:serine/threonine-protein kinase